MPGCRSCGGRRDGTRPESLKALRSGYPGPAALPSGMYPLGSHPDCDRPYWGQFAKANVYVIDQQGPHEKIFRRSQRREASAYARQHDATIRPYVAFNLCEDAMVEFFGS